MDDRLKTLLADLDRVASLPPADRARGLKRAAWLAEAQPEEQREFLTALLAHSVPLEEPADELLRAAFAKLVTQRRGNSAAGEPLTLAVVSVYRHLGPPSRAR